jgi:PPM family protein phosphatase
VTVIVVDVLDGDEPPDPTLEIDVVPTWADDATAPTPSGTLSVDADPTDAIATDPTGPLDRAALAAVPGAGRKRAGVKKFAVAFVAAAAVVIGFVVFSVWASSGYFVAFNDDDEAIVFKGRPGGALWIDPTAQNEAGPTRDQLEPDRAELIDDEPRFDSEQEAIDFLRDSATTTTTTTTTSTTTTTTIDPTVIDPNATTIAPAIGTGADGVTPSGVTTTSAP